MFWWDIGGDIFNKVCGIVDSSGGSGFNTMLLSPMGILNVLIRGKIIALAVLCLSLSEAAWGEPRTLVPDATTNSTVKTHSHHSHVVQGGVQVGNNLFHSFQVFSIPTQQSVELPSHSSVQNILLRVTGKQPTHINGTLKHKNRANIFLLNPDGIHFGETAHLDINGSFLATTADSLLFESQENLALISIREFHCYL
ncbi:MAG: filamentous hemagglutinin N-terminal domain-containing protein [Acaryochloridaceae cyanobacterium RL_2_7]|nr:filamentous hemagglutinin N-terminal domain-containing protein [Acaryochloridaceae cyanobacterium RL_2_7]